MGGAFDPLLLARIEDAGLNASAPTQQRWLDGWLLRFSPGKAKRARCVNAVAAGRQTLAARLAQSQAVFDAAGLPLIVRITPFTVPSTLDAELAAMGWRRFDDTRVMVRAELDDPDVVAPAGGQARALGLEAFAQRVGGLRGSPLAQRQAHGQRLVLSPVPFRAFEWRVAGEPVACGQYAVEGDLAGLYDVFTAPAARGRGHATALCRHLLREAMAHGARHAYLQVEADNHPARAVYRRLGFADGYAYHYRTNDPGAG